MPRSFCDVKREVFWMGLDLSFSAEEPVARRAARSRMAVNAVSKADWSRS
jgi:hypothetical protein